MSLLQSLLRKRSHKGKRQVLVEGASHVGLIRPHNEDSYVYARSEDGQSVMLGVADGMGGHEGGEVASFLTVRYLLACLEQCGPGDLYLQRKDPNLSARSLVRCE